MVLKAQLTTKDDIRAEGDFHKRYIVKRTSEAAKARKNRARCWENLWNEIQLKVQEAWTLCKRLMLIMERTLKKFLLSPPSAAASQSSS